MSTIKSYTDIEQSKKLAEILPLESADYFHAPDAGVVITEPYITKTDYETQIPAYKGAIPCWSLAALLGVLPKVQGGKPVIALDDNYITYPHMSNLHTKADNLVDACYEMIIRLNELNLL